MSDAIGLHDKYAVKRKDASPRHPDCRYFVLDLTHDPETGLPPEAAS